MSLNSKQLHRLIRFLPEFVFLAVIAAMTLLAVRVASAQERLPELNLVEVKKMNRIDGTFGAKDTEIVFSFSNVSSKTVTVYGRTYNGRFSPIGANYAVDPEQGKFVDADDGRTLKKIDGVSYTASRTVRPGETIRFSIFSFRGSSTCFRNIAAAVQIKYGKNIMRIISPPLIPCN